MLNRASIDLITYFVRAHPRRTAVMVFLLVISGLAEGLGFFSLLPALELVTGGPDVEPSPITETFGNLLARVGIEVTAGSMLFLVAASIAAKSGFLWLAMREVGYTVSHVATQLRLRLIRALMHASWNHFTSQPTGAYASAIAQEAHRASWAYRAACEAAGGLIRILAYLTVAFLFSWQVSLGALALSAFVLFSFKSFVSMGRTAGQQHVIVLRSLTESLTAALPGIKPIKAMGKERFLLPLLERDAEELNAAQRLEVLASESLKSLREPVIVGTICAGLYAVVTYSTQPIPSVMVLVLLFYRIVGSVNVLQLNAQQIAVGEEAFKSIRDHTELAERNREAQSGSQAAPELVDVIRFEDVSLSHGDHTVLDGVSFEIPAGEFTAMLGPSGSGKTTLLDLLCGLRRADVGKVLVDGVDLDRVDMSDWRSKIGYVPQAMGLFHGTVYENVTLGDERITREEAKRALEDAGAWEFLAEHEDGIDRVVGEGGSMLSGGQRQRILMARALVGSPSLLLLDEATTALDPETEAQLCQKLRELAGQVTIVAVSHQSALRDAADHVFEVSDGSVKRVRGAPVATS